jgi:hypothetical protein
MALSWGQVLMLPLDVSNSWTNEGLRMDLFWKIVYISTVAYIYVIIPALNTWYEADPDWSIVTLY